MGQVAEVVQEQEVDATVHGIAWGQVVQLLSEDQGHPVALEEPAPVKMSVSLVGYGSRFLKDARLETGGGPGTLLVDAGAMLPGDNAPSGRRQEVEGAISYIVQHAGKAATSDAFDDELPW